MANGEWRMEGPLLITHYPLPKGRRLETDDGYQKPRPAREGRSNAGPVYGQRAAGERRKGGYPSGNEIEEGPEEQGRKGGPGSGRGPRRRRRHPEGRRPGWRERRLHRHGALRGAQLPHLRDERGARARDPERGGRPEA